MFKREKKGILKIRTGKNAFVMKLNIGEHSKWRPLKRILWEESVRGMGWVFRLMTIQLECLKSFTLINDLFACLLCSSVKSPIKLAQKIFVRLSWKAQQNNQPIKFVNEQSDYVVLHGEIWESDSECQTATLVHACQTLVTVIQKRRSFLYISTLFHQCMSAHSEGLRHW